MYKNSAETYGLIAKLFHWIIAALLLGMFIVAYTMTNIANTPFKFSLYTFHKSTGLVIFILILLRLAWRYISIPPALPTTLPSWQKMLAEITILILYALVILMPLSGFLMSTLGGHSVAFYGLFAIPAFTKNPELSSYFGLAHEWFSYMLIATFCLHVLGALYHHFILKDTILRRMWFE